MPIFGLTTRRERDDLQAQIEALKAEQIKYQPWLLQTAASEKWSLPDPSVYNNQADLFRLLGPVLTAVEQVALAGALTEFNVVEVNGEEEPKDIPNHEFEQRLYKPNPLDSRFEFLYGTIAHWKLNGNSFWWLNKVSPDSSPDEMWVIPPSMIQPIPDERMYLKGYMYYPGNGMEIFMQPWEIVHFKRFNPFSRFMGLSAIESIALVSQGDLGMQDWSTRFFKENNARMPGILTFEQMIQEEQWKKIKEDTREASKNRELLMLRGTGQGGVKWMQNAVSQKEMEFLEARKATKSEIYSVLAPGLESMLDPSATEANANAGKRTFTETTVYPMLVMMQEKITLNILESYGEKLRGEFEDIRITDRQLELQERTADEKIMTLAELREEYKSLNPLGDERDDLLVVQINAQTGQPEPVQPTDPAKPETIQGQEPTQETNDVEADNNSLKAQLEDLDKWKRKALKRIGKLVKFESDYIPLPVKAQIEARLVSCKTPEDVRAAFVVNEDAPTESAEMVLLEAIKAALASTPKPVAQPQPINFTLHNHPSDPTPLRVENVVNVPEQKETTINVQTAPITVLPAPVENNILPTPVIVEAAKAEKKKNRKVAVKRTGDGYEFTED